MTSGWERFTEAVPVRLMVAAVAAVPALAAASYAFALRANAIYYQALGLNVSMFAFDQWSLLFTAAHTSLELVLWYSCIAIASVVTYRVVNVTAEDELKLGLFSAASVAFVATVLCLTLAQVAMVLIWVPLVGPVLAGIVGFLVGDYRRRQGMIVPVLRWYDALIGLPVRIAAAFAVVVILIAALVLGQDVLAKSQTLGREQFVSIVNALEMTDDDGYKIDEDGTRVDPDASSPSTAFRSSTADLVAGQLLFRSWTAISVSGVDGDPLGLCDEFDGKQVIFLISQTSDRMILFRVRASSGDPDLNGGEVFSVGSQAYLVRSAKLLAGSEPRGEKNLEEVINTYNVAATPCFGIRNAAMEPVGNRGLAGDSGPVVHDELARTP